jgi:hypothetical protein
MPKRTSAPAVPLQVGLQFEPGQEERQIQPSLFEASSPRIVVAAVVVGQLLAGFHSLDASNDPDLSPWRNTQQLA